MYGHGANGKTVLLDVLRGLVGASNISYVPLSGLVERFQSWPLAAAKVNICGELPTDIGRGQFHQIEGMFKDCVSGGDIEIERKGADKYTSKCRARFVMATNSLPTFVDRSEGIWRRLRIIPFPVQIADQERDVHLAEKIVRTELPGVLMWALDGLADVIRRGGVPDCPAGAEMKSKHRLTCDHEREFLTETYTKGTHLDRIKATEMYTQYRAWIDASGYKPMGAGKFYARVEEVFPHVQMKAIRIDSTVTKGFLGLKRTDIAEVPA
jgi:putative DNA primase/helicase